MEEIKIYYRPWTDIQYPDKDRSVPFYMYRSIPHEWVFWVWTLHHDPTRIVDLQSMGICMHNDESCWSRRTLPWVKRGQLFIQLLLNYLNYCNEKLTYNSPQYSSATAFSGAYTRSVTLPQTQSSGKTSVHDRNSVWQENLIHLFIFYWNLSQLTLGKARCTLYKLSVLTRLWKKNWIWLCTVLQCCASFMTPFITSHRGHS